MLDQGPVTLYDSRRDAHYAKPLMRGWLHLIWFEISLVVGTIVIIRAHGAARVAVMSIYAASVSALFGVSALYHRGNWSVAWNRRLQRLDHVMIFFLIAGSATPTFVLAMPGGAGVACLAVMWSLTLAATITHLFWMSAPEALVGGTFIGLGLLAGVSVPSVWIHAGVAPAVLVVVSGALYIVGAISYDRRWLDRLPAVFGYHEVFHAYVCAAATCQYIATAFFIA